MVAASPSGSGPESLEVGSGRHRCGQGPRSPSGGLSSRTAPRGAQRLFELGIATRPDFDTVASVSGGSLTSAQWAIALAQSRQRTAAQGADPSGRDEAIPALDVTRDIVRPLQALTARDIRTGPVAQKFLLPWNWFRGGFASDASAQPALGAWWRSSRTRSARARSTCCLIARASSSVPPTWPSAPRKGRRPGEVDEAAKRACPAASSSTATASVPTSRATRRPRALPSRRPCDRHPGGSRGPARAVCLHPRRPSSA